MKKAVLAIFLSVLLISLASALDITLTKSSYYPGETLQAEIPDAFTTTLTSDNIGVYYSDNVHESGVIKGIVKVDKKYYFYAVLPEYAGQYSLKIENIKHYDGLIQSDSPIVKNFSIVSTNSSYLSVSPAALYAIKDFQITVKGYNDYQTINVDFAPANFKQSFELGYGEDKIVYIPITGISSPVTADISINSYRIKAVVSPPSSNQTLQNVSNETIPETIGNLDDLIALDAHEINASVLPGINNIFQITIVNRNQSLKDINISSPSTRIALSPLKINLLTQEQTINVTINTDSNIDSSIKIRYNNDTLSIPVRIEVVENPNNTQSNIPPLGENLSCSKRGGYICDSSIGETCSGSIQFSTDGACCIGECGAKKNSSSGWIIGIIILIILAVIGFFLYKKYKKGESPEFIEKALQKRTEDYQQRFAPKKPVEVKKELTKE